MKQSAQIKKQNPPQYLALCGGVGGAKLALGLSHLLGEKLMIAVNTADDFAHLGLHISPDIDTVLYTLSGKSNQAQGWGLENESWNFLSAMKELGQESWFQLGDRDLATHVTRTQLLKNGQTLSYVTQFLSEQFSIKPSVVPMSDHPVRTLIGIKDGNYIPFQHYFVKEQCKPQVDRFKFDGIESATPCPALIEALNSQCLKGIIICPSNPFVSVDPILSIPGLKEIIRNHPSPVIAVTPIIGGQAIKGPTTKMMTELGIPQTACSIARHYRDVADGFILDKKDSALKPDIEQLGLEVELAQSLMQTLADRIGLAKSCLDFITRIDGKAEQQV